MAKLSNKQKHLSFIKKFPKLPCKTLVNYSIQVGEKPTEVIIWAYLEGEGALITLGLNDTVRLKNVSLLEPI
jgi:hypothetical protein